MAGRVLLISINRCNNPSPVFPLGLGHLDAALRAAGHTVRWLDLRLEGQSLSGVIASFQPQFIGISIRNIDDVIIRKRETFFGPLTTICPELRQLSYAPIVLGGSGFSIFPRELLDLAKADFGICGEGEASFLALLHALETGADYRDVPGLVYRSGDSVVLNERGPANGTFHGAARADAVVRHYLDNTSMLNLQTQRGCSHRCCYCTYPLIEGTKWRRRDPDEVAEEMAGLQARGARYVFIVDSVFNSSCTHATAVCEALLRRNVKLRWGCFLRPQGLTAELMSLMRRAGLSHIEFGSDSFCDEVLEAYDKRLTFDNIRESSALAQAEKLDFCHFLVCGGPGETPQTLEQTFENSLKLDGGVVMALVGMRLYPNTPLFQRAIQEGAISPHTNFLEPQYYLSPHVTEEGAFEQLREFSRRAPNWIVGDPSPDYLRMADRLRAKGVVGPLWSYFAVMQRLALGFAGARST